MDYRSIPLNAKPSPPDERDYNITKLVPMAMQFPDEYLIPYAHPIKNQGQIGSCVAHSLTYCREVVEEKQRDKYTRLSPGFIYGDRLDTDDMGEGMWPRAALKFLMNRGVCEYDLFPENDTVPVVHALLDQRWNTVMPNAAQYKISAYTYLSTVDEIKMALMALGPVSVMIPVYESFYTVSKENPVVPSNSGNLVGYHEMTALGWRKDNTWVVLNSWGEEWGDGGYCYLPFDFALGEAWGLTDNILPGQTYVDEFNAMEMAGSTLYTRDIKSIIIHHPGDGLPPDISIENRWNPHGYEYPAYDFGIEHDGTVKEGRPLYYMGAHCKADKAPREGDIYWYNKHAIGVVVAGDFTKYSMSDEQYNGLIKKVKELMKEYPNATIEEVKPHSAVSYTVCPGTSWDFNKFKSDLVKENKTMKEAILIWSFDDVSAAKQIADKLGNAGIFCRNRVAANIHPDAKAAQHLIVIGGPAVEHSNVKYLSGATGPDTAILAAQYAKTL